MYFTLLSTSVQPLPVFLPILLSLRTASQQKVPSEERAGLNIVSLKCIKRFIELWLVWSLRWSQSIAWGDFCSTGKPQTISRDGCLLMGVTHRQSVEMAACLWGLLSDLPHQLSPASRATMSGVNPAFRHRYIENMWSQHYQELNGNLRGNKAF